MSDRRRQARVQGGWASAKIVSKDSSAKELPKKQDEFVFRPTATVQQAPPVITISEAGISLISETGNGASRIRLIPDFITPTESAWMFEQLKAEIPWEQRNVIVKGASVRQPRLTCWFGDMPYTYSGLTLNPLQFSPLLNAIREQLKSQCNLEFNSMLANLYRNEKDSVDWHADDERSLGACPVIASLSFGATRVFELRKRPEHGDDYTYSQIVRIPLSSGTLLVMEGAVQCDWQHRVPKEYHDRDARINLTFRTIFPDL